MRADPILLGQGLQYREMTVAIDRGVVRDVDIARRGMVGDEPAHETAHVGELCGAAAVNLLAHCSEAVARVGRESIRRRAVPHGDGALRAVGVAIAKRRAVGEAVVFRAGKRAEELVVGAILHHQHDEVIDLASKGGQLLLGHARVPQPCRRTSADGGRRRRGSQLQEFPATDRHLVAPDPIYTRSEGCSTHARVARGASRLRARSRLEGRPGQPRARRACARSTSATLHACATQPRGS